MRIDQKMNRRKKCAVSIKMFITEFGEDFPENVKERLMNLESRCFLTRKEISYGFDLKHVEHLQYECSFDKEYAYGQFNVLDGKLYFSEKCIENKEIMQSPMVSVIFNALDSDGMIFDEGRNLKRLTENNIDYVVDSILSTCPQVSQSYIDIIQRIFSQTNNR